MLRYAIRQTIGKIPYVSDHVARNNDVLVFRPIPTLKHICFGAIRCDLVLCTEHEEKHRILNFYLRWGGEMRIIFTRQADMAQLVEHHLAKVGVAGSNPVVRSICLSEPA